MFINRLNEKKIVKLTGRCNAYNLRIGTVVVVNFSLDDQDDKQLFGYITATERSNELLKFEMIVSSSYVDKLSRPSIAKIHASCNIQKLIQSYNAVHMAEKSKLLQGIINPNRFIPNGQRRRDWMVSKVFITYYVIYTEMGISFLNGLFKNSNSKRSKRNKGK